MLGPLASKYMWQGYKAGIWYFTVPFEWETKEKKRVIWTKNKIRKSRLYDNSFYQFVGIAWCGTRTWQLYGKSEESMEDLTHYVISLVFTVGIFFPACLYLNFFRAGEELVTFAYDFIDVGKEFQEKYVVAASLAKQRSKRNDVTGAFLASLWYFQVVIFTGISLFVLFVPDLPILPTGTWELPDFVKYPLILVQFVAIWSYLTTWYINQSIYCLPAIEYLFGLVYMLKEMELGRDEYTTVAKLRSPEEFIQQYRALQVLHAKAMYIYSPWVLPANEWTYVFISTYCIFGAIRLNGFISLTMLGSAFLLLYYLLVVFLVFAKVRQASIGVIESWKKRDHAPWVNRTIESLTPISVSIGGRYFVDHSMMIQMYRSILEGAADLLMI